MSEWFNVQAIYVMWLREMKKYLRARSRVLGSLGMPFFILIFMGTGFKSFRSPHLPETVDYLNYVAPGILAIVLQFGSMFSGIAILWDRQFGFLKEIMVTPVSRVSIVLGRTLGGVTTAVFQGALFFSLALFTGLKIPSVTGLLLGLIFMILIASVFVNLGLTIASMMRDMQGFSLIMNFIMVPIFLLSGALFPLEELPYWVQLFSYVNPLWYGVDGLRYTLIGISTLSPLIDFAVLFLSCILLVGLGTFLFSTVDVD
jgi:ABC-2 type transport system permease protein